MCKHSIFKLGNLKKRWIAVGLVTCSLLLVLLMTLFPFNFTHPEGFAFRNITLYFYHPSNFSDFLLNIILFIPFGFSLTYLLSQGKLKWIGTLIILLLASCSLSFTVESLQIFLPLRSSTISDILANSLGGFLGFLGFYLSNLRRFISPRGLTICFVGYVTLTFLLSIPVPKTTNLNNWDANFPLILGNERTEDRPWEGYISEVYLADQAIPKAEVAQVLSGQIPIAESKDSLVAFYQLRGKGNYQDSVGHLPNLSWQGKQPNLPMRENAFLSSSHWLATEIPASFITEKVHQTSQFTLITTVATANTKQTGPARIISLSGNLHQRNFTLGQEESNLIFRLRTPLTGDNGTRPELIVPGVFADTKPHHLVITYTNSLVQVYVDRVDNSYYLELIPAKAILSYLLPVKSYNLRILNFLYYSSIFIPLGFLLAFITIMKRRRLSFVILLIFNGVVLPALLLEAILATASGRNINLANFLLSIVIISITMMVVKVTAKLWLKTKLK